MPRLRTLSVVLLALAGGVLLLSAVPLEKKYSLKGFSALRWETHPKDAVAAEFADEVCSVQNESSHTLLLIGPYREESFEIAATVRFSPKCPQGSVGVIFNVQHDYEQGERPTYMLCRISLRGEILFAAVHSGSEYAISRERFALDRKHPNRVRIDFLKKRQRVELMVNGQKRVLMDEAPLPPGGFGFLVAPGTALELSDFYFAKYGEVEYLFKGVDVEKLFGRPKQ